MGTWVYMTLEIFYFKLMAHTISFYDGDYSSKLIKFLKSLSSSGALIISKVFLDIIPILEIIMDNFHLISMFYWSNHHWEIEDDLYFWKSLFRHKFSSSDSHHETNITERPLGRKGCRRVVTLTENANFWSRSQHSGIDLYFCIKFAREVRKERQHSF